MNNDEFKQRILRSLERWRNVKKLNKIHALMITTSLITDTIPLSKLIDSFADPVAGDLHHATSIFLRLHTPNLYICNSMIRALSSSQNHPSSVFHIYRQIQRSGFSPDHFTFPFVLKACGAIRDQTSGRCVHARLVKSGYEADVYVAATLIHMYGSCGSLDSARSSFDAAENKNVVAWTTMMAGYADNDRACEAIRLFEDMELAGVEPTEITVVQLLAACARAGDLKTGSRIHDRIREDGDGCLSSNVVVTTALLDMYARCGRLEQAEEVFDEMRERNQVSWNAMINAYSKCRRPDDVLRVHRKMCESGLKADKVTLLSLLSACGDKESLRLGQGVHSYIEKTNGGDDTEIGTSLVNMYSKSGDAESAMKVFAGLERRDVQAWTSMIVGLGRHGEGKRALQLFEEMEEQRVAPDNVTFVGVMSACGHAGMIDEGRRYFDSMNSVYGIEPEVEHYGCIVDLLSRAGCLQEAERLARSLRITPSIQLWGSILRGCEINGEIEIARRIGDQLSEFESPGRGVHVLLSNVYAKGGRWQSVQRARNFMWRRRMKRSDGTSSIEEVIVPS